jgi:hypothetical protein
MQEFISHWNGISILDEGKFPPHLVKNFIRVKYPYITNGELISVRKHNYNFMLDDGNY